jgi:hypothetical protein
MAERPNIIFFHVDNLGYGELGFPRLVNLIVDPKEREPVNYPHVHTWVVAHVGRLLREFQVSVKKEPAIPAGAPIDHVPKAKH